MAVGKILGKANNYNDFLKKSEKLKRLIFKFEMGASGSFLS